MIKLCKNCKNFKWWDRFGFRVGTCLVISYSYPYPTFGYRGKPKSESIPDQLRYYPSNSWRIRTDTRESSIFAISNRQLILQIRSAKKINMFDILWFFCHFVFSLVFFFFTFTSSFLSLFRPPTSTLSHFIFYFILYVFFFLFYFFLYSIICIAYTIIKKYI